MLGLLFSLSKDKKQVIVSRLKDIAHVIWMIYQNLANCVQFSTQNPFLSPLPKSLSAATSIFYSHEIKERRFLFQGRSCRKTTAKLSEYVYYRKNSSCFVGRALVKALLLLMD